MEKKILRRSKTDKKWAGVCGGLAAYFGISSSIVRLLLILFTLAGGAGFIAYLIAWLIIPAEEG